MKPSRPELTCSTAPEREGWLQRLFRQAVLSRLQLLQRGTLRLHLEGEALDEIVDALTSEDQARKLAEVT